MRQIALLLTLLALVIPAAQAQKPAQTTDLPHIATSGPRASLIVDGAPFLVLASQVDNSSGWPARLQALWPITEKMRLNTLEVPVYWEQIEPTHGTFDFTVVDNLVAQARDHNTRLIFLWFGTWKNGKMHYVPSWVKSDPAHYPRMITAAGKPIDVLSPNAPANRDADATAFAALMRHLRTSDPRHTVIMMQVENESGSLGSVRDFSPAAQAQFDAAVPAALTTALSLKPGTWSQVFGPDADETFAAWSVASYINAVAAAGKRELALPMYANNWLKSPRAYPISTAPGDDYPSGGPTVNMLPVWKVAAPSLDLIAPDIYVPNSERYQAVMRDFHTPTNPLMVPESLGFEPFPGASAYARYLFYALGQGAIGFGNFGLDRVSPDATDPESIAQIEGFRLLGSFHRKLAALAFAGAVQTAVEENGIAQRELLFGPTRALISFPPAYDPPASPLSIASGTMQLHEGRVAIAQLAPNEFLVAAIDCRVQFTPLIHDRTHQTELLRVEEGRYDGETWVPLRLWNGDETDYGLNFGGHGALLRVTIATL